MTVFLDERPDNNYQPVFKYKEIKEIKIVESCNFDNAKDLIALVTNSNLWLCSYREKDGIQRLQSISPVTGIRNVAWSPISWFRFDALESTKVGICVAANDNRIYYYETQKDPAILEGHFDTINAVAFSFHEDKEHGYVVASVSDDQYCRIWNTKLSTSIYSLKLDSPGMSVQWHPMKPDLVLVGELFGSVKLLDYKQKTVLKQYKVIQVGMVNVDGILYDCQWNIHDPNKFAALIGKRWTVWHISENGDFSCISSCVMNNHKSKQIRWSNKDPDVLTAIDQENTLYVQNIKFNRVFIQISTLCNIKSISWSNSESLLFLSTNEGLLAYKFD